MHWSPLPRRSVRCNVPIQRRGRYAHCLVDLLTDNSGSFIRRAEAYLPLAERLDFCDQVFEAAPEAVEPPDDQGVPGARVVERFLQSRTFTLATGDLIGEYTITASLAKGIELEIELLITGGDTGITNDHVQRVDLFLKS